MYPQMGSSAHEYPLFDYIEKEFGAKLLRYHYDREEREPNVQDDKKTVSLSEKIRDAVFALSQRHTSIEKENQRERVLTIIEHCQAGAIELGELLEERIVNSEETVKILEEYCEYIYLLYQKIKECAGDSDWENEVVNAQISLEEYRNTIELKLSSGVVEKKMLFFWSIMQEIGNHCIQSGKRLSGINIIE